MLLVCMAALACSSCVTLGKYEELESRNVQLRRDINATQSELNDLRDENADLQRQNQALNSRITDLTDLKNQQSDSLTLLQREIVNLQLGFDTVIENYNQKISGQSQDLTRANNLLAARTKELSDKEAAFKTKEENFKKQENELRTKQAELEQKESDARKALAAKERELENLRSSLNNARVGFADKGMKVAATAKCMSPWTANSSSPQQVGQYPKRASKPLNLSPKCLKKTPTSTSWLKGTPTTPPSKAAPPSKTTGTSAS